MQESTGFARPHIIVHPVADPLETVGHRPSDVLHGHRLASHTQLVRRGAGQRDENPAQDISRYHKARGGQQQHEHKQPQQSGVHPKVSRHSAEHTAQDLVIRVAEKSPPRHRSSLLLFGIRRSTFRIVLLHLFRPAHACYHHLHIRQGDDLPARRTSFGEQFGYAPFDVVHNLIRPNLLAEVVPQIVQIIIQQAIGIIVDIEDRTAQINRQCLFHIP